MATGVHSYPSVFHLFSFILLSLSIYTNLTTKYKFILFFERWQTQNRPERRLSGQERWKLFCNFWTVRWLVWACKCAYDCALANIVHKCSFLLQNIDVSSVHKPNLSLNQYHLSDKLDKAKLQTVFCLHS